MNVLRPLLTISLLLCLTPMVWAAPANALSANDVGLWQGLIEEAATAISAVLEWISPDPDLPLGNQSSEIAEPGSTPTPEQHPLVEPVG